MRKLWYYVRRVIRLAYSFERKEKLIWNKLKKLHQEKKWRHGIFENDKYIETIFEIAEGVPATFYYMLYDHAFHCRVKVLEELPPDLVTDVFVLASHFNNHLSDGKVVIRVNSGYVEYKIKTELIIPALYEDEILVEIEQHFNTAVDVFAAFQRLVAEQEAPAIIIADILRKNEEEEPSEE